PRDGTRIVVGQVFAQPLEHRAGTGHARATLTGVVRETAAQRHLVAPDLVQVGVDVRRRRRGDATLALYEVERTAQPQMDIAERERSAVMWPGRVRDLALLARRHGERRTPPIDVERNGHGVRECEPQRTC